MGNSVDNLKRFFTIGKKIVEAREIANSPVGPVVARRISAGEPLEKIAKDLLPGRDPKRVAGVLSTGGWHGDLPQHTPDQSKVNSQTGFQNWRQSNPDAHSAHQKMATSRAAELSGPRTYTPAVQQAIQSAYDRGLNNSQVVAILAQQGIKSSEASLVQAAEKYGLQNKHKDMISTRAREQESRILELSRRGKTRQEIIQHLGPDSASQVGHALTKNGIRERIDWNQPVGGAGITLNQLAVKVGPKGFEEFNRTMEKSGLPEVSRQAFMTARSRAGKK